MASHGRVPGNATKISLHERFVCVCVYVLCVGKLRLIFGSLL